MTHSYIKPMKDVIFNYSIYSKNLDLNNDNECYYNLESIVVLCTSIMGIFLLVIDVVDNCVISDVLRLGSKFRLNGTFGKNN